MKNMKYLSALLLTTILVVTGCGKKGAADERLEKALKQLSDANSISMAVNVDTVYEEDDEKFPISANVNAKYEGTKDNSKAKLYMDLSLNILTVKMGGEVYLDYTKENTNIYFTLKDVMDDEWAKYAFANEDLEDELEIDTESLSDAKFEVKDFKKVEEVKSDKKGLTKVKAVVSANYINETIKEKVGQEFGMENDFVIYFYINDKDQIEKIYINLMDVLKQVEDLPLTKFDINIELSDIDNTKVEVPSDVEENSKELTDDELYEYFEELFDAFKVDGQTNAKQIEIN